MGECRDISGRARNHLEKMSVAHFEVNFRSQNHFPHFAVQRPGCLPIAARDSKRSQPSSRPLKPSATTPPGPRIIPRGPGTIQEPGIVLDFFWRGWNSFFSVSFSTRYKHRTRFVILTMTLWRPPKSFYSMNRGFRVDFPNLRRFLRQFLIFPPVNNDSYRCEPF